MKKIIIVILIALIVPFSFSNAFSLGEADYPDRTCNVWRVGMPPKMIEGKRQTQYNYCMGNAESSKRVYELEVEVIRLDSLIQSNSQRISVLEEENRNLKENILAKQDETKQLLIKLLTLMIAKK